jgi:hypothetical protein
MAYIPKERQCPMCDSTRVRPMAPRAYEVTSLVTWYECLRCPHIWYREKMVTSWTAQSPERRQSPRQMAKRDVGRQSGVVSRVPKTDKVR